MYLSAILAAAEPYLGIEPEPRQLLGKVRPTFDEWYAAKHGVSFDDRWMHPGMRADLAMYELIRALRDYATDMLAR